MSNLNRQLHQLERTTAKRRIPPAWTSQPTLAKYPTIGELIEAVQTFRHPDANQILIELARVEPSSRLDGRTVIVTALGRRLRMNYRRLNVADFDDALTDLATVVSEPGAIEALAGRPSIADTLVRRAGRRAERQRETRQRRQTRIESYANDVLDERPADNQYGELDDLVATRAALRQLRDDVTDAIEFGTASAAQWDNLRDAVLRPALGLAPLNGRRRNGSRARRALAAHIKDALSSDATSAA
jgi:hypothetical protein